MKIDKQILIVTFLLASTFLGIAEVFAQEDIFEEAGVVALADEELDQISGAGSPLLFLNYSMKVSESYSSQISGNAFQFARGIILPTQVTGNYNNVPISLDLTILIFNIPSADAFADFPHIDSLIP